MLEAPNKRPQTAKEALDALASIDARRAKTIRNILRQGDPQALGLTGLKKRENQDARRVDLNTGSKRGESDTEASWAVRQSVLELIELGGGPAFESGDGIDRIDQEIVDPAYFNPTYEEDADVGIASEPKKLVNHEAQRDESATEGILIGGGDGYSIYVNPESEEDRRIIVAKREELIEELLSAAEAREAMDDDSESAAGKHSGPRKERSSSTRRTARAD